MTALPVTAPPHGVVGREDDRAALRDSLGPGGAAFLLGEAGIGKSCLAGLCVRDAQAAGRTVLRGRTSSVGVPMSLRPLAEAFTGLFRTVPPPAAPEARAYGAALGRLVPSWRTSFPHTTRAPELVETAEAARWLLCRAARDGGALLVLEDLHDADPESLAVVEFLADNLPGTSAALLLTARPEAPALALADQLATRHVARSFRLAPLDGPHERELALRVLHDGDEQRAATSLDDDVAAHLCQASGGSPYLVLAWADAVRASASVTLSGGTWQFTGQDRPVPGFLVAEAERLLDEAGAGVRSVVVPAAVLGERFGLADLAAVTGTDALALVPLLRAADRFLTHDDVAGRDRYAFRHDLARQSVLATLHPAEHATVAGRAAEALRDADPALTGERCHLVARLLAANNDPGASAVYREAGRRAADEGATTTALTLFRKAVDTAGPATRADAGLVLAEALAESGQLDEALALLDRWGGSPFPDGSPLHETASRETSWHEQPHEPRHEPPLHATWLRIAWSAALVRNQFDVAARLVRAVERPALPAAQRADLTLLETYLGHRNGSLGYRDAITRAREVTEEMTREAGSAGASRSAVDPRSACRAWLVLSLMTRPEDARDSMRCHQEILRLARAHDLTGWQAEATLRLAGDHFQTTGSPVRIAEAIQYAESAGAQHLALFARALLGMVRVLRAEHDDAAVLLAGCRETSRRMGLEDVRRYADAVLVIDAAHRGAGHAARVLVSGAAGGLGPESTLFPLVTGLGLGIGSLLEEDREAAREHLAAVERWEAERPNPYSLTGRHGLDLLLGALRGGIGPDDLAARVSHSAAALPWNAQFAGLAEAVVHGRAADRHAAAAAFARAERAGPHFPTAWHLGLRLVAEAALADGWGDPGTWLRSAEEYFHRAGIMPVADACRALIRSSGGRVRRRRTGSERIPERLAALGITVREHEVLAAMRDLPTNKELADRLFLSPRTVEKHVSSLIRKLGVPDRRALAPYARD